MKLIVARLPVIFTSIVLLAAAAMLTAGRLEYCGQPDTLRPQNKAATAAESSGPTLAPPQKIVFVQVETDKPDLEIGWVEN